MVYWKRIVFINKRALSRATNYPFGVEFSIKVDSLRTKSRWMQAKMSPEEKESSKDSTAGCGKPHVRWCGRGSGRNPVTPTRSQALNQEQAQTIIALAVQRFTELFGYPSVSTVAPCYLWNSTIEKLWQKNGISVIQTAGYRCDGRDKQGSYHQDLSLIRAGDISESAQLYLVRNVMYEPVDGNNDAKTAYQEAMIAYAQALPISISTHRYNYTRTEVEFDSSLQGLDQLLSNLSSSIARLRYVASPELGEQIAKEHSAIENHFNGADYLPLKRLSGLNKLAPFLWRLYYRHPKLTLLAYLSGLIMPAGLLCRYYR